MHAFIRTCISVVHRLVIVNERRTLMVVVSVAVVSFLGTVSPVHAEDPGGLKYPPAPWTYLQTPSSSSAWCESSPLPGGEPDQCWCTGGENSPDCAKIKGLCTGPIICDYRNMCVCRADGAGDIPPF